MYDPLEICTETHDEPKAENVFVVFLKLEYGESEYTSEGVSQASAGTVNSIVGVATSEEDISFLIASSHFQTLEDSGFNPIKHPWTVNEDGTYSVTVDGSREQTTFSNTLIWSVEEMPANQVVDLEL